MALARRGCGAADCACASLTSTGTCAGSAPWTDSGVAAALAEAAGEADAGVQADASVPAAVAVAACDCGVAVDSQLKPEALGADDDSSLEALAFTSATMALAASALLPVRRWKAAGLSVEK